MLLSLGLVALGLVLLVFGGECLLRGAVGLATLARLTPAVIGLTVVAAGTSVPELAVSAVAAVQGKVDITVGNVVGSNIFNIAFILGLAALIRPLAITGNTIRLEYPVLAVVTLLCVAVCDHGAVYRLDGVLFLVVYALFTAYLVSLVRRQMTAGEAGQLAAETAELGAETARPPRPLASLGLVLGGVVLLTGGAHATVTGAVELGRLAGLSERVIGLTIVSIGTGLPEVVTSLVSSIRGRDDVAIGNVIGSNLFNILGILGINALVAPLPISPEIAGWDNWWMLGVTVLLFPLMFTGRRINRWEGLGLLAVYAAYMVLLLRRD
ncbi:MAG TPA: calcium/sodium antiporter [Gemmataceae bacterium]|jgi:cation:H+ antiporter|nr:calcium/sodium antiporter [Gemmataceae bacterium]